MASLPRTLRGYALSCYQAAQTQGQPHVSKKKLLSSCEPRVFREFSLRYKRTSRHHVSMQKVGSMRATPYLTIIMGKYEFGS